MSRLIYRLGDASVAVVAVTVVHGHGLIQAGKCTPMGRGQVEDDGWTPKGRLEPLRMYQDEGIQFKVETKTDLIKLDGRLRC